MAWEKHLITRESGKPPAQAVVRVSTGPARGLFVLCRPTTAPRGRRARKARNRGLHEP